MDGSQHADSGVPRARRSAPQSRGLRRDRLLSTLDEVRQTRLGLVVAPPGAGKTTLMAQWAATCAAEVAWLRMDPDDGHEGRLAGRVSQALTPGLVLPDGTATTARLATAIDRRDEPLVLVLDDMHAVGGTAAEAELERLLAMLPGHICVLVGSRHRPSVNLARCELPRAVTVSGADLAFRPWEVERLFAAVYRAPLTPDDAADLARRTAGWAAGLHLFNVSTAGSGPTGRRSAVAALARRSRYAEDYLETEILSRLSRPLRWFLLRTSVLDTLTPERCDALMGQGSSSGRMLADAARQCPMVTRHAHGDTFAVHEVLRRHLETQLEAELGSAQARAWWCRAAEVLESGGSHVEAVRARARGADWGGVRRLLHAAGPDVLAEGAHRWADVLPGWFDEDDPWASLVLARRLLDDGRLAAAAATAERAEQRFTDPVAAEHCRRVVAAARTWGAWPDLSDAQWPSRLRAATRRDPLAVAREAESLDPPYRDLVRGLALLLAGDVTSAREALVGCAQEPDGVPLPALAARLALAALDQPRERSGVPLRVLDRVAAEADLRGLTWLARLACGLAASSHVPGRASSPLAGGAPDAPGGPTAAALAADCDRRGDPWGALLVTAASALAQLRAGDPDAATLERLVSRCRELDAGVLEAWMRSVHALVAGLADLPDAGVDAESAESYARFAAAPGAVCLAYAGLAVTRPDQREELLELASVSGAATGMGPGPWPGLGQVDALLWGRASRQPSDPVPVPVLTLAEPRAAVLPGVPAPRGAPVTVVVRCFGEFRLTVGGEPLDLSVVRPRARSVLRMLAVHAGRMVHREQLADALWGDVEPAAALHNLQVNLSNLRGLLSAGAGRGTSSLIVREGDAYGLALPQGSVCDVLVFDQAVEQTRSAAGNEHAGDRTARALRRALEVYTGDLLPEEGPADWAASLREQYRAKAAKAAASLAALELQRDPAAAIAAASRSVEIDACQDSAWRTLIAAYRLSGDLAAGEQAQRRYADVLLDLGVAPDQVSGDPASMVGSVLTGVRRSPPLLPPPGHPDPGLGTPIRS